MNKNYYREAIADFLWSSIPNESQEKGSKSIPLGLLDQRKGSELFHEELSVLSVSRAKRVVK